MLKTQTRGYEWHVVQCTITGYMCIYIYIEREREREVVVVVVEVVNLNI